MTLLSQVPIEVMITLTRAFLFPRFNERIYRRNERAGLRLCDVGRRRGLAARARVRFGELGGLFLRDSTTKRATLAIRAYLILILHHDVRLFRHALREELLQVGRLRGRREIRLEDGEAVSSGCNAARYRRDREIHARGQYAQQQSGSEGERLPRSISKKSVKTYTWFGVQLLNYFHNYILP